MTFPAPPFPPWVLWAARGSELVCDVLLVIAAVIASRGAPASVTLGFGSLEWIWPLLLGAGGVVSAIGTVTAWLGPKLAGCCLAAGGLLSWAGALLVADGPTTGQVSLLLVLVAAAGLLSYRVVVILAMTHLKARRDGAFDL